MRIYKVLFFLPLLFLLSCREKRPAGILDHEQMEAILVDIHIVDGLIFNVPLIPDSLYKHSAAKYQYVFEQHHIDSAQFKKSFIYYSKQPDQLYDIYDKVVAAIKVKADSSARIKTKADSLERIKQNKINQLLAKRAADSLKRVNQLKADSLARKKAKADSIAKTKTLKKKNVIPRK